MRVAPVPFAPWDAMRAASLMTNTIGRQTGPSILSRAGSALPSGVVLDDLDNCVLDLSDEQTIDRRDIGMASGRSHDDDAGLRGRRRPAHIHIFQR